MLKKILTFVLFSYNLSYAQQYDKISFSYKNVNAFPIGYEGINDLSKGEESTDVFINLSTNSLISNISQNIFHENCFIKNTATTIDDINRRTACIVTFWYKNELKKKIIIDDHLVFYLENQNIVLELNTEAKRIFQSNFPFLLFFTK